MSQAQKIVVVELAVVLLAMLALYRVEQLRNRHKWDRARAYMVREAERVTDAQG